MVKEFVDQSFEQKLGLSATASDYLRQEADRLKAKLQNAEQAVQKFREDTMRFHLRTNKTSLSRN